MWSSITVGCVLYLGSLVQANDLPQVVITQGTVVGSRATDGDYFEFHGIPYADSTSGRNRFKAPSAPPSFQDVFIANRKDLKCVRALGIGYEGTEDCLVANVFTPRINATDLLPVMVWIKGREFDQVDKPHLSFKNFMGKDVLVVSLNYRESILGFLCLGTETAPGNAGLKDIIAGLKWVRENIARFGGDPENVSLFGHGSGAAAVDLVSLSPMSEGLVQKIITQSGTALAPWAVTRDNIKFAVDVAEALGHEVTDIEQLSEVFTRTSVAALMAVINELDLTDNSLAFAPCLEKESLEGTIPFLLKSPYEILTNGEYISLPFMAGFVDKEGTIRADEALEGDWLEKMDDSFIDFIQPDLSFENMEDELSVIDEIKYFYFNNQTINSTKIDAFLDYQGDTMILVSTIREARMRASSSNGTIYLYQFSYKGKLGETFVGPLPVDETGHSEDLAYLFRDFNNTVANNMDVTVSEILIERWTSFAKTGLPESATSKIPWHPYTRNNSYFLRILNAYEVNSDIGATLEVELENPHPETLSFWDHIYEDHFLDAIGRWKIIDREEEEDSGNENGEDSGNEGGSEGEDGGNGGEDGGNGGEDSENGGEDGGNGGEDGGSGDEGGGGAEDGGNGGGDGGNGNEGGNEGGSGGDDGGNGGGEEEVAGEDDDDNSASTAVGYTFLIISLFAVIEKICLS